MAMNLMKSDTFERPVIIVAPDGTKTSLTAEFLYVSQKEADAIVADVGEEGLLDKVLKGWKPFKDPRGKLLKYSVANKKDVVETPYIRSSFLLSFARAIIGLHLGNSGPSPVPGRRHPSKKKAGKAIKH